MPSVYPSSDLASRDSALGRGRAVLPAGWLVLVLGVSRLAAAQSAPAADEAEALRRALAADVSGRPARAGAQPAPVARLPAEATPTVAAVAPVASGSAAGSFQQLQTILPDIALILDVAGAAFIGADAAQTGGHDPSANGFNLQQLEMHLESSVDPYFQLEAKPSSPGGQD